MPFIKRIQIKDVAYDLKATYDDSGNNIEQTYAKKESIPTKVSQLNNDSGFLTSHQDISTLATKQELNNKVDKVEGKTLSTNDFTTELKTKLDGLSNYDDTELSTKVSNKVDKIDGKVLSSNDYTNEDKAAVSTITNKVDKVNGKQLSSNDYTSVEKTKLSGIEEQANKYVHPSNPGYKHIPTGGAVGQLLTFDSDGTAKWADTTTKLTEQFNTMNSMWEELQKAQQILNSQVSTLSNQIDVYSYGVEWDITVASPSLTRIGNPLLHKSLPIQSAYRGCVANGGVINYYLFPDNWGYKEDGVTASVLNGTDGTVRVHTPKFYGKSGEKENKRWVRISTVKIDDSWIEIPELLIDAYRNTVDTTVSATPKAVSVVNTSTAFRGGGNRSSYDTYLTSELDAKDVFRSDLGKPRTNVSRTNMRNYAKNAGSELLCYEYYKWIFYWNYVIEYANFNSQAAYNAELTSDGYRQGGLGDGVTTWNSDWNTYNGYYPLTPCGYCNEFGNFTGIKDLVIPATVINDTTTVASKTFKVPRWRGFDNPFGDIWTNLDGIIIERTAANQPSNVYTTTDSVSFGDDNTAKGKMTIAGVEIASDGYTKQFDLGETAEIIPSAVGGSTTTYMCDYHWCNAGYTALRTLLVGGRANNGGYAGLGCFYSYYGVGHAYSNVGFRTLNRVS